MNVDEIVSQMAEKVGISPEQAQQVVQFLMEHKDDILGFLGSDALDSIKDKLPGGLGGLLGGGD